MINIKCASMTALSICNAQQHHCLSEDLKITINCLAGIIYILRYCSMHAINVIPRTIKKDHVRHV